MAGGIGIAPFLPMVQEVLNDENQNKKVTLIYGVNKEDEFLYHDELNALDLLSDQLEYKQVVASDDNWKGKKGFVTDVLKEMHLDGHKIYLCGPKPMIQPTVR